jgi:Mrp family chromosome partitioning ATPase
MRLAHATRPPAIILVTSPGPDEGAPEVTLGLAAALATLGRRTIAIEADLRRPTFAERLGAPGGGGLIALIRGGGRLDHEVIELEPPLDGAAAHVLPAGAARAHPQVLLASLSMKAVLLEARARADIVLVCTPPAGRVGDALTLAPLADAALLVARLDATDADAARRARESLEEVGTRVVGVAAIAGRRGAEVPVGEAAPASARRQVPAELVGPATAPEAVA